jgi:hypothetical protein
MFETKKQSEASWRCHGAIRVVSGQTPQHKRGGGDRLTKEISYWDCRAEQLKLQEESGKQELLLGQIRMFLRPDRGAGRSIAFYKRCASACQAADASLAPIRQ